MEKHLFDKLRAIIYEKSGISLHEGKEALVSARLQKRMRALGIEDYRDYVDRVMSDADGTEETVGLLDAISTNVTSFFREPIHFEFLAKAMGGWLKEGKRRFRFWSAACSSGEEPYSMAMTLLETLNGQAADMRILATDISTRALEKGRVGSYDEQRIAPVLPNLKSKYFERQKSRNGVTYAARETLRRTVLFRRLNLSAPPFPMTGPMDAIFCRNVLIYFDQITRKRLLDDAHRLLKRGGYLMVGHAESLTGMISDFRPVRPSIYVKD